jgi:hypothetical protein
MWQAGLVILSIDIYQARSVRHQTHSDYQPLFILCPGRSFSSVVCGMLGQHPELYGLPETNFFVADTVGGLFQCFAGRGDRHRLHGLVRTLAQLHDGEQTETAAERAWEWLRARLDMSTRDLAWYVASRLGQRRMVEKSPSNCAEAAYLERLHRIFPTAYFLHLSRHPRSTSKSLYQVRQEQRARRGRNRMPVEGRRMEENWLKVHGHILRFTERLPVGQSLHLQGELLLADPDRYLRQVAEWLEICVDAEAIEAMKHPEASPFATVGPNNARGGNNRKYLEDPRLRTGKPPKVNLIDPLEWMTDGSRFSPATVALARRLGYR